LKNFNLEKYSKDAGRKKLLTGTMNADVSYELAAFRISQILENSKGSFTLSFNNGIWEKLHFQDGINNYLQKAGYPDIDINRINYSNASFSATQTGEVFLINNLSMNSDSVNCTGFGMYQYEKGLDVKLNMTCKDKNGTTVLLPLKLYGPLLFPCMNFQQAKRNELCF